MNLGNCYNRLILFGMNLNHSFDKQNDIDSYNYGLLSAARTSVAGPFRISSAFAGQHMGNSGNLYLGAHRIYHFLCKSVKRLRKDSLAFLILPFKIFSTRQKQPDFFSRFWQPVLKCCNAPIGKEKEAESCALQDTTFSFFYILNICVQDWCLVATSWQIRHIRIKYFMKCCNMKPGWNCYIKWGMQIRC